MLGTERELVQRIDKLIFDMLKEKMEIKQEKEDILGQDTINQILKAIKDKMEAISLLFEGDFSVNERIIEERMETTEKGISIYDKVANSIILKRLENVIAEIERLDPQDGRLISVCFDRKFFIEKILAKNISSKFVEKYIQKPKDIDER